MTVFHLFAGNDHYPQAGLGDYIDTYKDLLSTLDRIAEGPKADEDGDTSRWDWITVTAVQADGSLIKIAESDYLALP